VQDVRNEKKSTKAERVRGSALSRSHTPLASPSSGILVDFFLFIIFCSQIRAACHPFRGGFIFLQRRKARGQLFLQNVQ
jgi:hypothetical protein